MVRKAILAGVSLKKKRNSFESAMKETGALCTAANIQVAGIIIQQSNSVDVKTVFRSGKLEELKTLVQESNADLIIFYNDLRVQQAERIYAYCGCEVIDRQALILNIFASRARSHEAKMQVELARLQYDLPRVQSASKDFEGHSRGGSLMNRGAGEMRSSLIARKYASRIADLKKQLEQISRHKEHDELRRGKTMMRRCALVGYTNAGKSSLMNALLETSSSKGQSVSTEDMLFATLDTSVRQVNSGSQSYLLYDTVGFVSDLPHTLIEAFKSTLDAARDADLLIHVIDISDAEWIQKKEITEDTLNQIGAGHIPILAVYNKIDLIKDDTLPQSFAISCKNKEGIAELQKAIVSALYPNEITVQVKVSYDRIPMVSRYRSVLKMEELASDEHGVIYQISGPKRYIDALHIEQMSKTEGKIYENSLGKI